MNSKPTAIEIANMLIAAMNEKYGGQELEQFETINGCLVFLNAMLETCHMEGYQSLLTPLVIAVHSLGPQDEQQ